MTNSIFVTATQRGNGKTTVVLGLVSLLERALGRVGYFKPVGIPDAEGVDPDVRLMRDALGLDLPLEQMAPVTMEEVSDALARGTYDQVVDRIFEAYSAVARKCDFVVCEGTDYLGAMASLEFNINADLSKNLGAPILLVANGQAGGTGAWRADLDAMLTNVGAAKESFDDQRCELFGVIVNRVDPDHVPDFQDAAAEALRRMGTRLVGALPRSELLEKVRLEEIVDALGAEVLSGRERLDAVARKVLVAAMSLENVLQRMERGSLVITPGDREEILLGLAASYDSPSQASPAGVILTGGLTPRPAVMALLRGVTADRMPMLKVDSDTYDTAIAVNRIRPSLQAHQKARIEVAKDLVDNGITLDDIVARAGVPETARRVTPKQFLHKLGELARRDRKRIVLPEGNEERIIRAAAVVLQRGIADLTLLGQENEILDHAARLGLTLEGAEIVDPATSPHREAFAKRYIDLRTKAGKNPTWELAYDLMTDVNYYGTMMVHEGQADGMVSGSVHTTAHTLRPALEFIKTREGVGIASSVFFMALPDQVLVYGDCAVNPNPNAQQLADIALAAAETAKQFEVAPYVAMLSYSTGSSGKGSDVEKVREATRIVHEQKPDLPVEGPIQYDAAIDPSVARTKLPNSRVAGAATVFIFPDLNTGNISYKAVQRSANAIAVGPVMQGLRKPVNDLSRGCLVADIINTIAITAIQAQRN